MLIKPNKIDDSNRGDHFYLAKEHECYFFYEFTAGKLAGFSQGNQLVLNLKKSVTRRQQADYKYKTQAISTSAGLLKWSL